jgi:integrase
MRKSGAGRRWELIDQEKIHKHDLTQIRTEAVPLEQIFQRSGEKPFTIRLTFLSSRPRLARVLANAFWIVHQEGQPKATLTAHAHHLRLFSRFLDYRKKTQADVRSARQLHQDVLKEMAIWLLVKRRLKRQSAAHSLSMCCWLLRQAKRLYPTEFDPGFSTPSNVFPSVGNERPTSKALSPATFKKILAAATKQIIAIRQAYEPGDVPTSAQQLIPFMILIAARTGINSDALYRLERDCIVPHEIDEEYFYCMWDKPRAGRQQKQLHRVDRRKQMGVVELIQFVRQYTEPLALKTDTPANKKLFLYLSENTLLKHRLISSYTAPRISFRRLKEFRERHQLPYFSFSSIRPSAATLLYLQTGGNLGKVRQFLQHAHFSTTIRYVLNQISEQFNARVIQKAQERMVERVTVIPETRKVGIKQLNLPKPQAAQIVEGRFDTGCGTCRNPYDSPQMGERKGQLCTSFHACFSCPNGLWFLEDQPWVIAIRNRFLHLRSEMKPGDWDAVYGDSVRILNDNIISAFRPEQVETAMRQAKELEDAALVIAKGMLR